MAENWGNLIPCKSRHKLSTTDQCSSACEAADLHPISSPPWLLIPPQSQSMEEGKAIIDSNELCFYDPVDKKIYKNDKIVWRPPPLEEALCVGSCYDWLTFINTKCVIYLKNPFREELHTIRLPPIDTLPCMASSTLSPDGDIEYIYCMSNSVDDRYAVFAKQIYGYFVHKLVMSSSPEKEEGCIVMMIYGEQRHLAVCKLGDMSWTPLNGNLKCNYNLYYSASKKLFHVLCDSSDNTFETWDFGNFSNPKSTCFDNLPHMPLAPPSLSTDEQRLRRRCAQKKYLAELDGKLLLLVRHYGENVDKDGQIIDDGDDDLQIAIDTLACSTNTHAYKTFRFDAYEFDWSKQQWVLVNSLGNNGDDVLFLGTNNSMTFSTRDFPGIQCNSIYFTDDFDYYFHYVVTKRHKYGGHDLGIFSFNNNSIDHCYYAGDLMKISPTAVWISPSPY